MAQDKVGTRIAPHEDRRSLEVPDHRPSRLPVVPLEPQGSARPARLEELPEIAAHRLPPRHGSTPVDLHSRFWPRVHAAASPSGFPTPRGAPPRRSTPSCPSSSCPLSPDVSGLDDGQHADQTGRLPRDRERPQRVEPVEKWRPEARARDTRTTPGPPAAASGRSYEVRSISDGGSAGTSRSAPGARTG